MSGNTLRQVLLFLLLVLIALGGGALIAYPAHFILTDVPFSSLAERGSLLCGLVVSLWYARHVMRNSSQGMDIGFRRPAEGWWPPVLRGYLAGLVIMLVLALGLWGLGLSRVDEQETFNLFFYAKALLTGLLAGIGAGLIEETIFRGALFSGLQQRINVVWAILLTSLLYSAVHFLEYPEPSGDIHWYTGLQLFPVALAKLTEPIIFDHFLTLFLLGLLLSLLRWRDGHIWCAFGVHAGIIMMIKLDGEITDPVSGGPIDYLVNPYSSRLGWLSALWLMLLVSAYAYYLYRKRPA